MSNNIESMVAGLSTALGKYVDLGTQQKLDQNTEVRKANLALESGKQLKQYDTQLDLAKSSALEAYKQTLEGKLDPETAGKLHPEAVAAVEGFFKQNGRYPTLGKEADTLLKPFSDKIASTQKSDEIRLSQLGRQLSSDKEFTNIRTKRDNLENVAALIEQTAKQPDGPDKRQLYEQSLAQVRVLIGNQQISEKEIEHLLPSTYRGTVSSFLEKITNKPQGTEAQAFMERATDFFKRESKVTVDQMNRRVTELSTPYKHILDRNADTASEIFSTYKVNHPKYNPAPLESNKDSGWSIKKL